MLTRHYNIKAATRQELEYVIAGAADEGWNPGLHDADCYYPVDPQGFLLGCLDGAPIASLAAIKYDEACGFLGFYIVKPGYRGQGYGKQILAAAMDYLAGCNIGLDGVVEQQANYQRLGFQLAFRNSRYQCQGGGMLPIMAGIVNLTSLPFERVAAYDRPFFPARRQAFLKTWIGQPESVALGILQDGHLAGMGVLRKCRAGYKMGPLYADSLEGAEALFLALKAHASASEPIYLDVPEANRHAVRLATRQGMQRVFETARMYSGPPPDLSMDRLFGITSFEIG